MSLTTHVQKCLRNCTMIKKVRILWKNGLNFKLKHRNAQKSILSGRFGALTGRPGDLMKNLETPGKTGRVGRYVNTRFQFQWVFKVIHFLQTPIFMWNKKNDILNLHAVWKISYSRINSWTLNATRMCSVVFQNKRWHHQLKKKTHFNKQKKMTSWTYEKYHTRG